MILELQLGELMNLQNQLNIKMAGKDWLSNPEIKPYRAAWVECAELMDWLGYKWWKNQVVDRKEVLIELVDILHFILGMALQEDFIGGATVEVVAKDPLEAVEGLTLTLVRQYEFPIVLGWFIDAVYACDYTWEQVEALYHGKYALNKLRQDMGDKEGTYSRDWNGIEDNVVMYDIATSGLVAADDIYQALHDEYMVAN